MYKRIGTALSTGETESSRQGRHSALAIDDQVNEVCTDPVANRVDLVHLAVCGRNERIKILYKTPPLGVLLLFSGHLDETLVESPEGISPSGAPRTVREGLPSHGSS